MTQNDFHYSHVALNGSICVCGKGLMTYVCFALVGGVNDTFVLHGWEGLMMCVCFVQDEGRASWESGGRRPRGAVGATLPWETGRGGGARCTHPSS